MRSSQLTGPRSRATAILCLTVSLGGCASTSLYSTQDSAETTKDDYVLLAPYFSEVENQVTVIITQAQAAKSDSGGGGQQQQTYSATIALNAFPKHRSYAFVKRNAWYATSANLTMNGQGLLSSSDTSSTQQVGAILTELAQTVAGLGLYGLIEGESHPGLEGHTPGGDQPTPDPCVERLKALTTGLPYVKTVVIRSPTAIVPIAENADGAAIDLKVTAFADAATDAAPVTNTAGDGLVAYLPSPGVAELRCVTSTGPRTLTAPALTFYFQRMRVDPKRDFFWNPQDSLTFSNGFITGHKHADQSPVKTAVDTVTAPVRALFPSVSVTQSTQVQTGGGKPDQTTTSTSTTTGPPKNP